MYNQGGQPHNNPMNHGHNNNRMLNNQKPKHNEGPVIVDENEFDDTLSQACNKGKTEFITQMETTLEEFIKQTE